MAEQDINRRIHLINGTTRKNMSCGKTQADMKRDHEAYSDDINMVNCPECVQFINKII